MCKMLMPDQDLDSNQQSKPKMCDDQQQLKETILDCTYLLDVTVCAEKDQQELAVS